MEEAPRSKLREYLEALLIAVVFLQFANTFVVETFYIPSGSMEDTLLVGDHLFVNRFIYAQQGWLQGAPFLPSRAPRRGDILVFRSVQRTPDAVVKRCIGLPGETLAMTAKRLYVDGQPLEEGAYVVYKRAGERGRNLTERANIHGRDNFEARPVPPGHFFLLGDNRDESYDSRYWGPLPAHLVKGRALVIYWSNGGETLDGKTQGVGEWLLHLLKTAVGFFPNTRWERTGRLIR